MRSPRPGNIQSLVSDYERDRLWLNAEMVVRFALALEVSADELLGLQAKGAKNGALKSRRLSRPL